MLVKEKDALAVPTMGGNSSGAGVMKKDKKVFFLSVRQAVVVVLDVV